MISSGITNALVRILIDDRNPRQPVGAGFLVSPRHILTCAHVVADALHLARDTEEKPSETLWLDFPLIESHPVLQAQVIKWSPVKEITSIGELEDIALLELNAEASLPRDALPTPVVGLANEAFFDREIRMCGFPKGMDSGDWVNGRLRGPIATGWVEFDQELGRRSVAPGFSGTAVWDKQEDAVVGMVVSIDSRAGETVAYMIPVSTLIKAWPELDHHSRPPNPYRGLNVFREQDATYFFGRGKVIDEIQHKVQKNAFVAVLGASGSGKSSLVFAGLFPRLREEGDWLIADFRPKNDPFKELALCLISWLYSDKLEQAKKLKTLPGELDCGDIGLAEILQIIRDAHQDKRFLLIIDQFEELYTLSSEQALQRRFIDQLLHAVHSQGQAPDVTVLITMRADFMGQAVTYGPLAETLNSYPYEILKQMSAGELRAAIEEPAQKLGVDLESGLTERILQDLGEEPGNLPLLEFALTQLWERQTYRHLTNDAYTGIGGVNEALAHYADEVYADFTPKQQDRLRRIFVQLVRPGQGTEDTRQMATRDQVQPENWMLVTQLADKRLVVTGRREKTEEETVEVVHEALIRHWQPLQRWINDDRKFLTWQEQLRAALRQWEVNQRDEGALLHGAPLAVAKDWLAEREADLSQAERQFIRKSLTLQEQEETEKEAQRQRELKNARKIKNLAIGLAVLLVIAVGAALFAGYQQYEAVKAKDQAVEAQKEAERRSFISIAQSLIAYAHQDNAQEDRERAALLARQAYFLNQRYEGDVIEQIDDALRTILHLPESEQSSKIDTLVEQVCQKVKHKVTLTPEEWEGLVGPGIPYEPCEPQAASSLHLRSKKMETDDALALSLNLYEKGGRWYPKRYVNNEFEDLDEVIFDHATGLMWQKAGSEERLTYADVQEYIEELNRQNFAGYSDWRLSTIPELMSLLEPEKQWNDLYIDSIFDIPKSEDIWTNWVWGSDKRQIKGEGSSESAWLVYFGYGSVGWYSLSIDNYVRAVRSRQ